MSVPDAAPESCFVDTNIWLYAFIEGEDHQKTTRAKELLEASRTIIVSTQVINEVCVNLLKKAQFAEQMVIELNKTLLLKASALREQYTFSFWDSTIVSSALHAGASVLYSEDMQAGLVVENRVRIINPFDNLQPTGAHLRGSSG